MSYQYQSIEVDTKYANLLEIKGKLMGMIGMLSNKSKWNPYVTVNKGYNAIHLRNGKFIGTKSEGMFYKNPATDQIYVYDMRTQQNDMPRQVVIMSDNLTVEMDAFIVFRIVDVSQYHFGVIGQQKLLSDIAISHLRAVCAEYTLIDCFSHKDEIINKVKRATTEHTQMYGIIIENFQITDIRMNQEISNAMAAVAIAKQQSAAKILIAQAEVECAELMKQAADLLNSPAAMQLRQLETHAKLYNSPNAKLIFLPADSCKITLPIEH